VHPPTQRYNMKLRLGKAPSARVRHSGGCRRDIIAVPWRLGMLSAFSAIFRTCCFKTNHLKLRVLKLPQPGHTYHGTPNEGTPPTASVMLGGVSTSPSHNGGSNKRIQQSLMFKPLTSDVK